MSSLKGRVPEGVKAADVADDDDDGGLLPLHLPPPPAFRPLGSPLIGTYWSGIF